MKVNDIRWRRVGVLGSAAALAIATLSMPQTVAQTVAESNASAPSAAVPPETSANIVIRDLKPGAYEVPLVTGDRVRLAVDRGGRSAVDVEVARRADGTRPHVAVTKTADKVYAIPDDVVPLLAAGRIERELFNVAYLAASGYGDPRKTVLPLIVKFHREASENELVHEAKELPGSRGTVLGLESINSAGVGLSRAELTDFWSTVKAPSTPPRGFGAGVESISLDHDVKVNLDMSVPQIGAPEAWAGGFDGKGVRVAVLDTGIDESHPDLAGKVVASASFIPGETVADGHGHGTHVASTIVGSGAASGGQYKGVAPGADLIVGKVLGSSGSGDTAGIVDGMEWAATDQHADIISMSLGCSACLGDNTDPMELAVNSLTKQTGALFVLAAGNSGPGSETIGSPGSADEALTVAAVDKSDHLASFSSRGPRRGDGAFKPDIAAPGVAITAARAAGTSMGTPAGDSYTTASGTSMATPHIAGAAAIMAQKHPSWTAAELKPALMSTAVDDGYTAYEQGAGRVDVARAVGQDVFATTANLDFKNVPPGSAPITKTVRYTNSGPESVTLNVTATAKSRGGPAPDGTLTVSPASLTIPAGGNATATATLVAPNEAAGAYTGAILATGPGTTRLSTPAAFTTFSVLTVTVKPRKVGVVPSPDQDCALIDVYGVAGGGTDVYEHKAVCWQQQTADQSVTFTLPGGTYFAAARSEWHDANGKQAAYLFKQEFPISGDAHVVLDSDEAMPITVSTPRPATLEDESLMWARKSIAGNMLVYSTDGDSVRWLTPTQRATSGEFTFAPLWVLGQRRAKGASTGKKQYYYVLRPLYDSVPGRAQFSFAASDLATVQNDFHTDQGTPVTNELEWGATSDFDVEAGSAPFAYTRNIMAPRSVTMFVGPTSTGNHFRVKRREGGATGDWIERAAYRFDKAAKYNITWGKRPFVPAPVVTPPDEQLPPEVPRFVFDMFKFVACSGCREGNQFNGLILLTSPDGRHSTGAVGGSTFDNQDSHPEKALEGIHLYHDGQELPAYYHWVCSDLLGNTADCRSDR